MAIDSFTLSGPGSSAAMNAALSETPQNLLPTPEAQIANGAQCILPPCFKFLEFTVEESGPRIVALQSLPRSIGTVRDH